MPDQELRLLPSPRLSQGLGCFSYPWNQILFCLGRQLPRPKVRADLEWPLGVSLGDSVPALSTALSLTPAPLFFMPNLLNRRKGEILDPTVKTLTALL